ncbi:MAG: ExeM/NucH family extracellular endonuclease [Caldilineales bacterium]
MDNPPTVTDTTPTNGATNVPVDVAVDVTFSEPVVISGTIGIDCSSSGVQNVTPTGGPSTFDLPHSDFDLGESCTVTIDADQVTDQDGDPNHMAEDYSWSFETTNGCFGGGTTPIHDIQGSGLVSPILGQQVIVEALVNADYQNVSSIRGFFMEEPDGEQDADPATSEGIFIYDNNFGVEVAVGDYVRVSGTVSEFQEQTQLSSITAVTICDNDPVFATPVTVTLPFSETVYPERFEGMSVTLPQTMTVSENFNLGRGGILTLSYGRLQQPTNVVDPGTPANDLQAANNRNQITLDDGNLAQNPDPIIYPPPQLTADNSVRSGDEVTNILGVVTQGTPGWSSAGILYRIYPYEMPTFTDTNPRPPAPDPVRAGSSLRVSSFNVLNYFLTLIDQGPICGPDQNEACRGAYNSSEFTRQRNKLLQALYILDADVLGLMELENTPGVEPLADLVDGLNGLTAPGTYDYIDAGTFIPGDVIKVGIIYKPGVVQPVGDFAILNSLVDPNFNTDLNRPALAQTFEEIGNHGRFTVVVNHLKSKGGCPSDPNDPNADQGDGQACWNLARENAVNAELSWIGTDPTNSGDPDFIIMGDLNAYAMEDPIAALETAGYTNLETAFQGADAYSYVFFAQAGSLDHSMASPSMVSQVNGATTWHINADEPSVLDYNEEFKSANQLVILYNPDQYRTSDHDPLLIGLNLEPSEADLFVSKIANPDPVTVGETLYYTITTQNVSTPTVATDVVITDVLPAGVSFNGAAAYTGTCNESGGTVVCDMGNIAPDVIESVLISVTVDTAECPGVLSNYVEVASNVYDPNPQNNSQTLETDVECVPPNIEVDPTSLASTQLPDTQVIQTLTISNTGGSLLDWMIDEEPLAGPPEAGQPVTRIDSQATVQAELSGEDNSAPTATGPRDLAAAARAQRMLLTTGLLLIPDSTNDRVMAFDPTTGNLVDADFIPADPDNLSTPKSAIFSAGGDSILVSDQIDDVVQEYDLSGNYLGVFAPAGGLNTAILDNITGIALRPNGNLLVTVNSGANQDSVAEFDTSGNYLGNFVANGSGGLDGPFDVYERTGDWLVSGINSDNVLRYDLTGAFIAGLAGINNFPQQVAGAENSNVLIGNFGGTQEGVVELTAAGALVGVYDPSSLGGYRGAYELPNGNILTTNGSGVHEIDRSGNLVQSKITGVSAQYIEYVAPQADCTNLADVPWLSTDPITGTTSPGLGTNVDVTFDSTGLAGGVYNANLCITSNDPDPGPGNGTDLVVVPVTLTVESPPEPPNIDVNPLSLASTQPANMQTNQPLTIANTGGGTLDWTIDEEATTAPPFGNGNTTPDPASASENVGDASRCAGSRARGRCHLAGAGSGAVGQRPAGQQPRNRRRRC